GVIGPRGRHAAAGSPGWYLHTGPGAVVAEEGHRERRDADVAYVPDGVPGLCRHARRGDVIGDEPQGREIRDALVAGEAAEQMLAGFDLGDRVVARRRTGPMHWRLRGAAAADGQRCCDAGQQRSQVSIPHRGIIVARPPWSAGADRRDDDRRRWTRYSGSSLIGMSCLDPGEEVFDHPDVCLALFDEGHV